MKTPIFRLNAGIILFIIVAAIVVGHFSQWVMAQDTPNERPGARFFQWLGRTPEQSGSIRERIRRRFGSIKDKGEMELELAGLKVSVWRPSQHQTERTPLVIFSHGFHGSSTQSAFLMK